MKIDVKAMALTWAILWGGIVLMMGAGESDLGWLRPRFSRDAFVVVSGI